MKVTILLVTAPVLDPATQIQRFTENRCFTIRGWLSYHYGPDFVEFTIPTFCMVNGVPVLRAEWDTYRFQDNDVISFVSSVGDAVTIIIAVIAVIVAIAAYLLIPDPEAPSSNEGETVFNLRGQSNRMRLGEPIEVSYGRCRFFPSMAAPAYTRYVDNEPHQYSWLVVGQGEYEFEEDTWSIDDTPFSNFEGIQMEVLGPDEIPTLFSSAAHQAIEVNNVELKAPNDEDVEPYAGPFTVNGASTLVTSIEVDISFPQGLYITDDEGRRGAVRVDYEFDVQPIDDVGTATGAWETVITGFKELATPTAQRYSLSAVVASGRYQIRARRTSNRSFAPGYVASLYWEAAKGYAPITQGIGNLTAISVVIKASGNLNNSTKGRINGWGTRKLPIYDVATETWSEPTATRNPIDAFCDLFRSRYGAKLADSYLDLNGALADLHSRFIETEDWFDMTFDTNTGVWDAAKMILKVGRAVPIPQGSLVTAVRDEPATLPAAIFNQTNIVKNSLSKQLQMYAFQEYDSVSVTYTDYTSWKPEQVVCSLPGGVVDRTENITLAGCTNRNKAYQWGMYLCARRKLQRKTVIFKTGLEGFIPTYMDLVTVTHDTVRVGFGGFVVDYDDGTGEMVLSDAVAFHPSLTNCIAIRSETGGILGEPIVVTPGSAANRIILATDPEVALDFSPDRMPPLYVFGIALQLGFIGKVVSVTPSGKDQVEIAVVNYDAGIYAYEEARVPDLVQQLYITDPLAPRLGAVRLAYTEPFTGFGLASWILVAGASSYYVEISTDSGASWQFVGKTSESFFTVTLIDGENQVRVAALSSYGKGLWTLSNVLDYTYAIPGAELMEDGGVTLDEDGSQTLDESAP